MICASAGIDGPCGVRELDPFKEYRPQSSEPGSTCGFDGSVLLRKWVAAWAGDDTVGDELRALFLALRIPPNDEAELSVISLSWSHSNRSSGEMFCTARLISPIPIRSGKSSLLAGVEGTSFLAKSGNEGCSSSSFFASSCTSASTSPLGFDPIAPSFSFSSSDSRVITVLSIFSALFWPLNWKMLSLFFVAVEIGIGGFSCSGFD